MTRPPYRSPFQFVLWLVVFVAALAASPAVAKTAVDFNPNLNFSAYKTFSFLGGVKNLVMLQLDPDVVDDRIHHIVNRELGKKGLHEVAPNQHPDLVVRYWVNPSQQVNVATMGEWAPYGPYIAAYWAPIYNEVSATATKENSLIIDLIDSKSKDLAWRIYMIRKIANSEKDWKKTDEELTRGFEDYPPSDVDKEAKKKERAAHSAKSQ